MKTRYMSSLLAFALVLTALGLCFVALAQNKSATTNVGGTTVLQALPRLIKFSGELGPQVTEKTQAAPGGNPNAAAPTTVAMTFSLYESPQGGAPLFTETQDVEVDEHGRYTVLLGAASPDGVPMDLFAKAQARWLGAQPQLPGAGEQPRIALMVVPYAVKAADADSLGGKPASAYVSSNINTSASKAPVQGAASTNSGASVSQGQTHSPSAQTTAQTPAATALAVGGSGTTNDIPIWTGSTTLGNSALVQVGGKVALGTKTPATTLDVRSTADSFQALTSATTGVGVLGNASSTTGATFGVQGTSASSGGIGVLGKSTSSVGSTVGVMGQVSSPNGIAAVFRNGADGEILRGQSGANQFSFDKGGNLILISGDIIFSDGSRQVKAATLDQVTAGTGLSGGGKADPTGNVTLKLDTAFTDGRYLKLAGGTLTGALTGTSADFADGLTAKAVTGDGVSASSSSGFGVFGTSDSSDGVKGQSNSGNGVVGVSGGSGKAAGVSGSSASGDGVNGVSNTKFGVHGTSTSGFGVASDSTTGVGVSGTAGNSGTSIGVLGSAAVSAAIGVAGLNTNGGTGVQGQSMGGGRGVQGLSDTKGGVVGMNTSGDGVAGVACSTACGSAGVFGVGQRAGLFQGNVGVSGTFAVSGVKSFHIDHPLDPAGKYLNHFSVESNEVLNTYSGNVTTDRSGTATVILPAYFAALNVDYRYQLTVMGQFAQAIIFREIEHNSFVIKTDQPSVKVSWQVTGVRHDAWVRNHPPVIEEAKPQRERGYYLHPEFFGQPEEKSITWLYHPDLMRDAQARWSREAEHSR